MKKTMVMLALVLAIMGVRSQDLQSYQEIVQTLSAAEMHGRGYVGDGVRKAEKYIVEQYQLAGVKDVQLQPFTQNINTFPGNATMQVDGKELRAGIDFVMREFSCGAKGEYDLLYIDTTNYDPQEVREMLSDPKYANTFIVVDFWFAYRHPEVRETGYWHNLPIAGGIYIWPDPVKFYKAYGQQVTEKPIVWVGPDFPRDAQRISIDVESRFEKDYVSNNIIARLPGKRHDSAFVLVAHYDHLGHFGRDVHFPGVNDNASGTALLLTLARHYAQSQPDYDIIFLSVAGEESGLLGSTFYTENPQFPLSEIRYVLNADMIGDNNPIQYVEVSGAGERGFQLMERLNKKNHYFERFERGELASNSDHYPFAEKEVPCILFEQEGGDNFRNYHTPLDDMGHAKYETYPRLFRLITDFIQSY